MKLRVVPFAQTRLGSEARVRQPESANLPDPDGPTAPLPPQSKSKSAAVSAAAITSRTAFQAQLAEEYWRRSTGHSASFPVQIDGSACTPPSVRLRYGPKTQSFRRDPGCSAHRIELSLSARLWRGDVKSHRLAMPPDRQGLTGYEITSKVLAEITYAKLNCLSCSCWSA